jgi:hypothetical protein
MAGSVDVGRAWVSQAKTSDRLINNSSVVGPFANSVIKGHSTPAANVQWASVCFGGNGELPGLPPPGFRCGQTFCASCAGATAQGGGALLTLQNQFWWVPSACKVTTDGDSGGPLFAAVTGGVSLLSIHRGGAYVSGACSGGQTWVAMGSRLDHILPALGVQLITG